MLFKRKTIQNTFLHNQINSIIKLHQQQLCYYTLLRHCIYKQQHYNSSKMTDAIKSIAQSVSNTAQQLTNQLHTDSNNTIEVDIGHINDYNINQPKQVEIGKVKAVIVRTKTGVYALGNKCSHYGGLLYISCNIQINVSYQMYKC